MRIMRGSTLSLRIAVFCFGAVVAICALPGCATQVSQGESGRTGTQSTPVVSVRLGEGAFTGEDKWKDGVELWDDGETGFTALFFARSRITDRIQIRGAAAGRLREALNRDVLPAIDWPNRIWHPVFPDSGEHSIILIPDGWSVQVGYDYGETRFSFRAGNLGDMLRHNHEDPLLGRMLDLFYEIADATGTRLRGYDSRDASPREYALRKMWLH